MTFDHFHLVWGVMKCSPTLHIWPRSLSGNPWPVAVGAHFQIFSGGNFRVMRGGDLFGAGLHFVPRERKNIKFFWACCVLPYFNSVHFA